MNDDLLFCTCKVRKNFEINFNDYFCDSKILPVDS